MTLSDQAMYTKLLEYIEDPKDRDILEQVLKYGGQKEAVRHTHLKQRTVSRRISNMKKYATEHGFDENFPETGTITNLPIFAKSIYQSFPEPRADGVKGQWLKTKSRDVTLAELIKQMMEGVQIDPVKPKKLKGSKRSDVLPVLVLTDAHLGLLAAQGETGDEWNLDMAMDCLKQAVDELVAGMPQVKEMLLADLGDLTHTDALKAMTPKSGNLLDSSHRYFDVARAAGELLRYTIDACLTKAQKVHVRKVRGNHDTVTSWHLCENLKTLYAKEPRVDVASNDSYHQTFQWGKNLLVLTHGDAAKYQQTYEYITTKWDRQFGEADYVTVMSGHFHHHTSCHMGKVHFETFCTLTKSDAYHAEKMYLSRRSMKLVLLDREGGEAGSIAYNPKRGDAL